jgi:TorA-specific chaperone
MSFPSRLTRKQWEALVAAVHRLCRVYWGPSGELCRDLLEESWLQPFTAVAAMMQTGTDSDLAGLRDYLGAFSDPEALCTDLEEGYVRLFVNDRGGITAPLYASCYEDDKTPQPMGAAAVRMQQLMTDLKIHLSDDVREPPDHLAIQLEVLYYLMTQAGKPIQSGGITAAEFAAEQMLPWVRSFHHRLANETRFPFFPLMTKVLLSVLQIIAALPESTLHR